MHYSTTNSPSAPPSAHAAEHELAASTTMRSSQMSLPCAVSLALLMLVLASCGSSRRPGVDGPGANASGHYWKYDDGIDRDDHHYSGPSNDDAGEIVASGQGANPADRRAIAAVTREYFAAALAAKGNVGCKLLQPSLAAQLAAQSGKGNCAAALTTIFKREHTHIAAEDVASMTVTGVHVSGDSASITLGFARAPESEIALERRHGTGSEIGRWKVAAFSDSELP